MIVTIREPRDCVSSLMLQFGDDFLKALSRVSASAEAVVRLVDNVDCEVLQYERPDGRGPAALRRIASRIGADVSASRLSDLNDRLSPGSVSSLIDKLASEGRFGGGPPGGEWDPQTHWHPNHVGDGRTGKHRQALTPEQSRLVLRRTRRYRERFGYMRSAAKRAYRPWN